MTSHSKSKLPDQVPTPPTWHARLSFRLLVALAVLTYLGTTGFLPILGKDEPRYVEIAREMLNSGDWVTPRLGGSTWFEKPVLLYWMVAASFGVFGVSEWAARLGPALCGLGTAAALAWMIGSNDSRWARWSGLFLVTSLGILAFSHGATFDIVLTFCVTLALAAWWKAQQIPRFARRYLAVFWIAVGLAFLAKGLIGILLPLGTVAIFALIRREKIRLGFWWGLPLALLTSLVWYGPVVWANGWPFIQEFFVQHHFQRFTSDKYRHHQPPWFYLEVLPLMALPWTPLLLKGLWMAKSCASTTSVPEKLAENRLAAFALAWLVMPVLFFSLSGSKLPGYILPALPGAAILMGLAVKDWALRPQRTTPLQGLVGATLLAVACLTLLPAGVGMAEKQSDRLLFQEAKNRGLAHLPVVSFHFISRTAEFYAAPNLLYSADGEPLRVDTLKQIQDISRKGPLLVLLEDKNANLLKPYHMDLTQVAHAAGRTLLLVSATPG